MKIIDNLSEINLNQEVFPIFFWDKWKTVEEELHHKQRLLCADEEGNVVAFTIYAMKFFKKADYLYVPLDKKGIRLSVEKEKAFLDEFHNYLKTERIADVIFPLSHIETFASIPSKCLYYKLGIMKVDLTQPEDEILSKFYKENKKQIRKAVENGVETSEGLSCLGGFYENYENSAKYKGFNQLPYSYFEKLISIIPDNIYCCCVLCNNCLDASYLCLRDAKYIYPLYSGTSFTPQYKGSKKFLLWSIYLKAKQMGVERYISGGYRYGLASDDPLHNVHLFKLGMGAEIEDGYHFIKIINPFRYNLVNFAMKCKSVFTGKNYSFVNLKGLDVKKSK